MAEPSPTVVAGAIAGATALLAFVVVHALWIVPIWGILSMLPVAAAVGALGAWAFDELAARGPLPPAPLDGIAFSGILLVTLVPTVVFGFVAGPVDRDAISPPAVLIPLLLAGPTGAAIGLALGGSPGSALALGVAALALAITIGHNLPFFPFGSPGWEKAFALVLVAELTAGVAFTVSRGSALAAALSPSAR